MATYRHRALARAATLGAEISESADAQAIYADAPAGYRFTATGTHSLATSYDSQSPDRYMRKDMAWASLLQDIDAPWGTEPCPVEPDENCIAYDCPGGKPS